MSVLVGHNFDRNEWVCQIPIFPIDSKNPLKPYSETKIHQMVLDSVLGTNKKFTDFGDLKILSIKHWNMHAGVAKNYIRQPEINGVKDGKIF